MATFKDKFKSIRQDWTTPRDVFDPLDAEFGFTLDAAAAADNALAPRYIAREQDAMRADWGVGERVWLNPPYGEAGGWSLAAWVGRALQQARRGNTVVMLIPARTNTNWFHDLCLKHGEVRFVRGRPKFGGADHGLPQPLCVVIFRP